MQTGVSVICPHQNCGHENQAGSRHCAACGGVLSAFAQLYFLPAYFYNEGLKACQAEDAHSAMAFFRLAARLNRNDPAPLVVLGKLHAQEGRLESAIDCWLKALEIAPKHETALKCLFEANKIMDAKKQRQERATRLAKKARK